MAGFDDLEAELRMLGRELDVPPVGDLTRAVRRRIENQPVRRALLTRPRVRAALVALALLLGLLVATPAGRTVVVKVFGFAGIEFRDEPGPRVSPGGGTLPGEQRMRLGEARRQVGFSILVPRALGDPDEVIVSDAGRVVSLVYRRTPYGELRLDEADGDLAPVYEKFVGAEGTSPAEVNGQRAIWVDRPHELVYVTRDGRSATASARNVTGKTLIWETGHVALRLEGTFDMSQAVAVAESAR